MNNQNKYLLKIILMNIGLGFGFGMIVLTIWEMAQ